MKKFMMMIMFVLVMFGVSYGAETADSEIYVRKEVFNAHMDSINSKFDIMMGEMKQIREEMKQMREEMREEIMGIKEDMKQMREETKAEISSIKEELKAQREEIKQVREEMQKEIKSLRQDISNIAASVAVLSQRVKDVDARIGDTQNFLYLLIVMLGILMALPMVQKFLEWNASRKPSITLEDVKRLIEESKSEPRNA